MERVGDGNEEKRIFLRKLCVWKNPIEGRDFQDYKLEWNLVPAYNKTKGDCFNQMKDYVQRINFETGQKVFSRQDLLKLPVFGYNKAKNNEGTSQIKYGIFKAKKDSNGKVQCNLCPKTSICMEM